MSDFSSLCGPLKKVLETVRIEDIMTSPVIVVHEEEDFSRVEEIFSVKQIRHLPVVNGKREIVGVVSQKDVYRHIAPRRTADGHVIYHKDIIIDKDGYYEREALNQYILNYIMNKNLVVLTKDRSLGEAIHTMVTQKVSCIPIVSETRHVVGIVTRLDILKLANQAFIK